MVSSVVDTNTQISVPPSPELEVPNTGPRVKHPWEYRSALAERETPQAFKRYRRYMELGGDITYSALAEEFGVNVASISRTAKKNNWQTRLAAYREQEAIIRAEKERENRHRDHVEKLESFRMRNEQLGNALFGSAAQLLQQANNTILEMKKNGDSLSERTLAAALQAAVKCSEQGKALVGSSLGVEALLMGISDSGDDYDNI